MTRDELARLIGPIIHQGSFVVADAILARYDLVPKGSVVVPEEPTPQMERAGADCFGALGENPDARYEVSVMYRAMLAARPRSLP